MSDDGKRNRRVYFLVLAVLWYLTRVFLARIARSVHI